MRSHLFGCSSLNSSEPSPAWTASSTWTVHGRHFDIGSQVYCRSARCTAIIPYTTVPVNNDVGNPRQRPSRHRLPLPVTHQRRPSPRRVEQSSTSPWHHKASNMQLEPRLSHLPLRPFEISPPSPPRSSPLPFLPSFQYLPANKVPTGRKVQNRLFQNFSTGLLVMPCNQVGKKVTSRSYLCSET